MSDTHSGRARRRVTTIMATLAVIVAVPVAVIAAHSFDDVPDSNQFHESIAWMQENGITIGCNPPANTQYCPEDNVSRQQMAAFMRRLAQTDGSTGIGVTDPADTVTVSGTTYVELLTLEATPTAEANVTLNGHVTLANPTPATTGSYQVIVARDSCDGTVVGAGGWSTTTVTEPESATVAVTASDVVTGATTYVLCAAETVDTSPDATATLRGLTATWDATA
ncbi:MAG: S-layer homology domain-containing protein [Acidimicrobiia bacterium]